MTTYSTQNPLGSTDPRDLYDNAENLDNFVNGEQPAYEDRLGKSRRSWQSVEDQVNQQADQYADDKAYRDSTFASDQSYRAAAFQAAQDDREGVFNAYLVSAGYQFAGDYAAGIEITQYNQVVRDSSGELWRVAGSTALPYTTSGAGLPEGGNFVAVGDAALRQELGSNTAGQGADLVPNAVKTVENITELSSTPGVIDGQTANVQGSEFRWSSVDGEWIPTGPVSVKAFGAVGDGLTPCWPEILECLEYCVQKDVPAYIPTGVYMYEGPTVDINIPAGGNLVIFGDGPDSSIIKEVPGTTETIGRFNRIIRISTPVGGMKSVILRDFCVDHSGSGTTGSGYDYEQAHCIAIDASKGVLERLFIDRVNTKEKIGGGIVLAAGRIKSAVIQNSEGIDSSAYSGGKRGDFEFQASVDRLLFRKCSGSYVQSEPNISAPIDVDYTTCVMEYCDFNTYDIGGYNPAEPETMQVHIKGCENGNNGRFFVRGADFSIVDSNIRASGFDWRNNIGQLRKSTITIPVNTETNSFSAMNISSAGSFFKQHIVFDDCDFIADSSADENTTGRAITNSGQVLGSSIDNFSVTLRGCRFSDVFSGTAYCYRNGKWKFDRCSIVSRSGSSAFIIGSDSSHRTDLEISDCDLTAVNGALFSVTANLSPFELRFSGALDYEKYSVTGGRPAAEWDQYVINDCIWLSDNRPNAGGYAGQKVNLRSPEFGLPSEFICTSSSRGSATFVMSSQAGVKSGLTADRPAATPGDYGLTYLDQTLNANGKPIVWNGTAWVDATGVVV